MSVMRKFPLPKVMTPFSCLFPAIWRHSPPICNRSPARLTKMLSLLRPDLKIISDWICPGSWILDLGCGDGALLAYLRDQRQVHGYGLEIDADKIIRCIEAGVNVLHTDLEAGLADFDDDSFDY